MTIMVAGRQERQDRQERQERQQTDRQGEVLKSISALTRLQYGQIANRHRQIELHRVANLARHFRVQNTHVCKNYHGALWPRVVAGIEKWLE